MMTANRVHRFLESLHRAPWDSLFAWPVIESSGGSQPRIWSGDEGVVLEVDLPGRNLEDIDVATEQDRLTVEVKQPPDSPEQERRFRARERSDGEERLEFRLPFIVDPALTDVVYQHGVVRISVKKPAEDQPRKLSVRG
jgi:HSP20 family protein